jgi:hypothetical protein
MVFELHDVMTCDVRVEVRNGQHLMQRLEQKELAIFTSASADPMS